MKKMPNNLSRSNAPDEEMSPSRKLCSDIQDDYWELVQDGKYKLINKKGFLDQEFYIGEEKYSIISSQQTNECFMLAVKDSTDKDVFVVKMSYGQKCDTPNQHIIVIEKFCRLSDYSCGIGREMAKHTRELAEKYGFDTIGVHPVAVKNDNKGYMSQDQLLLFYKKYLTGINTKVEFMESSGCVMPIEMEKRW